MIVKFNCNGLTRQLEKADGAVVAVRQDSGVDTVRVEFLQSEFNNITLSEVGAKFLYLDETGTVKAYTSSISGSSGIYHADWALTDDVADAAGWVTFSVKLTKVENNEVTQEWFSEKAQFRVYDTLNDTTNAAAETAQTQATNAEQISAILTRLTALEGRVTALE